MQMKEETHETVDYSGKTQRCPGHCQMCIRDRSIPGTPIDYPVVRTGDPDYYLNHTFSGRKSYLGTA